MSTLLTSPPALLTFLGAVLAATGVFWASVRTAASQKQIIELTRQLAEKNNELAKQSERIVESVTGGESFAYSQLALPDVGTNTLVWVINDSTNPLYGLSVRLVDLDKFEKIPKNPTLEALNQAQTIFLVGDLGPNQASNPGSIQVPSDAEEARFNIFFMARNGESVELYRAKKLEGKWRAAIKVSRHNKQVYEKIDPAFPRKPDGSIEW
jgi:hypothetical protein